MEDRAGAPVASQRQPHHQLQQFSETTDVGDPDGGGPAATYPYGQVFKTLDGRQAASGRQRPRSSLGSRPLRRELSVVGEGYIVAGSDQSPKTLDPTPTADLGGVRRLSAETLKSPTLVNGTKHFRKSVSLLSRLSMFGGRRKQLDGNLEDVESTPSEYRATGSLDRARLAAVDATGFTPYHKKPPKYVRMRVHNAKQAALDHTFLAQVLTSAAPTVESTEASTAGHAYRQPNHATWAAELSKDGAYLAAAGQDHIVRLYSLLSTRQERAVYEHEEEEALKRKEGACATEKLSAPVFRQRAFREFTGHRSAVHDLSWSKNNFLLSSSVDKTVRLWHPSIEHCIHTFEHSENVTCAVFHPTDDRFFLAGSLDKSLTLWSIPDKMVAFQIQESAIVTAIGFTPDGKTCIAGLIDGECNFYETVGLKRQAQLQVRSSRGKNAKGSKITSIETMWTPAESPNGQVRILISSNDSRLRLYRLSDKTLEAKFKGHENSSSHIKARFSDDGRFVICGSEDRRVFIWPILPLEPERKDRRPYQYFVAHSSAVTVAMIAPRCCRVRLGASGDPIYDLCNPPPVKLESRAEAMAANQGSQPPSSPVQSAATAAAAAAAVAARESKLAESPAYRRRSTHPDGNLIITADRSGQIRVFRQDCAHTKQRHDVFETGSFSRKHTTASRVGSVRTRLGVSSQAGSLRGSVRDSTERLRVPAPSTPVQQHSDERIISWRQEVESDHHSPMGTTPTRRHRSVSPPVRIEGTPTSQGVGAVLVADSADSRQEHGDPDRSILLAEASSDGNAPKPAEWRLSRAVPILSGQVDEARYVAPAEDSASSPLEASISYRPMVEGRAEVKSGLTADEPSSMWNLSRWRPLSAIMMSTGFSFDGGSEKESKPAGATSGLSAGITTRFFFFQRPTAETTATPSVADLIDTPT